MKKNILLVGFILSAGFFSCERNNKMADSGGIDTMIVSQKDDAGNDANAEADDNISVGANADFWKDIDLNVPQVKYPEISSKDLEVRGNDRYAIYSLGENILFDSDKAELRTQASDKLKEITASIAQRYPNGQIRIYGHTDAEADKSHNKELSEDRAEAVKNWLVTNAKIDESKVSIHPMGESKPVSSNATEAGKQQNRRVEIVVLNSGASQGNKGGLDMEKEEKQKEDKSK